MVLGMLGWFSFGLGIGLWKTILVCVHVHVHVYVHMYVYVKYNIQTSTCIIATVVTLKPSSYNVFPISYTVT